MNIGGGEAADQMVRMMLSGTEVMVRLSGSALKNLLALSLALARNHKKLSGKINLGKIDVYKRQGFSLYGRWGKNVFCGPPRRK